MTSPLTGSSNTRLLRRIPAAELDALWSSTLGFTVSEFMPATSNGISLHECLDTGFHYYSHPEIAGQAAFYTRLAEFPWYYPRARWDLDKGLELASKAVRLIEIGCGDGHFLERWSATVTTQHKACWGMEINVSAAERARSKGFDVTTENLCDVAKSRTEGFDTVCSFQVLEHVPDPASFLRDAISLLSPKGLLILAVPNRECHLHLDGNPLDYPPHHMGRWSAAVFKSLERFFPLRLEQLFTQPLVPEEFDRFLSAAAGRSAYSRAILRLPGFRRIARHVLALGACNFFRGQSLVATFRKTS